MGDDVVGVRWLIRHQLVRRSLGVSRRIPDERLAAVLTHVVAGPLTRESRRGRGLRLVATDLDWSAGRGPLVIGSGDTLLLALCGLRSVVGELGGDGRPLLEARIARATTADGPAGRSWWRR